MLDMLNVVFQANKNMHIFVIIAFISTKMLLTVWTFGNNVNNQVIG